MSDPHTAVCVEAPISTEHTHTVIFLHDDIEHKDTFPTVDLNQRAANDKFATDTLSLLASSGKTLPQTFPTYKWVFLSSFIEDRLKNGQTTDGQAMDGQAKDKQLMVKKPWFTSPDGDRYKGLNKSNGIIIKTLLRESHQIPTKDMVICGIGYGCAAAIQALMSEKIKIGGFIGLSGWLPFPKKRKSLSNMKSDTPGMRSGNSSPMAARSPQSRRSSMTADSDTQPGDASQENTLEGLPVLIGYSESGGIAPNFREQSFLGALRSKGAVGDESKVYRQDTPGIKSPAVLDDIIDFVNAIFVPRTQQIDENIDGQTGEESDNKTDGHTECQNPRPSRSWCGIV